jgi:hypothetical protein
MNKDKVLRQALELLDTNNPSKVHMARHLIRDALKPKEEPVAWADKGVVNWISGKQFMHEAALYERPQSRAWASLTDEEAMQTWDGIVKYAPGEVRIKDFARAIDQILMEKNA